MDDEVDFLSEADCPICKDGSGDKTQRRFELNRSPDSKAYLSVSGASTHFGPAFGEFL